MHLSTTFGSIPQSCSLMDSGTSSQYPANTADVISLQVLVVTHFQHAAPSRSVTLLSLSIPEICLLIHLNRAQHLLDKDLLQHTSAFHVNVFWVYHAELLGIEDGHLLAELPILELSSAHLIQTLLIEILISVTC